MDGWHRLVFSVGMLAITACGGSDKHSDSAADTQGAATGGAGANEAPVVPPAATVPPATPNSEPSNVPPDVSLRPNRAEPLATPVKRTG